jgi:hypothetical protein
MYFGQSLRGCLDGSVMASVELCRICCGDRWGGSSEKGLAKTGGCKKELTERRGEMTCG